MGRRFVGLGWVVCLLVGCGDTFFSGTIEDRTSFDPPASYQEWWAATESCSGRTGAFQRVEWFLATSIVAEGKVGKARWAPPHEIIIVRGYEADEEVVRHEMLHDLLGGDGVHASPAWVECDLLVN